MVPDLVAQRYLTSWYPTQWLGGTRVPDLVVLEPVARWYLTR